jgi:hypothetical protein
MSQQSRGLSPSADAPQPDRTLGLAAISRACAETAAAQALWDQLAARMGSGDDENGAMLDMGALLIGTGQRERGLEVQNAAITLQPLYVRPTAGPAKLRLLAFMRRGDFMANTPLDFLLEGSDVELIQYYVDGPPSPEAAPDHDVAFLAVGEAADAAPLLAALEPHLRAWPRPVLNARPEVIATLTRDGVRQRLAGCDRLLSPPVRRVARGDLAAFAAGQSPDSSLGGDFAFPLIVRPLDAHAGLGVQKVDDAAELAAYLADQAEPAFYVTRFVDYSSADGLYRKHRIVFIRGRPFISHMAVSPRWMVHYLNADMAESAANRADEARAMATFDEDFAARHADAFAFLCEAIPLDYFGIDCAETRDGRLLVFEADVAMIVHAMDPEDLYPYKKPAMAKLFAAFVEMLAAAA